MSEHVLMSIAPRSHSMDLVSWFPLFIPISTPLWWSVGRVRSSYVTKGETIRVHLWRRKDEKRVWYEWLGLGIHNGDRFGVDTNNEMG